MLKNLTNIKIIGFDLDGTLYPSSSSIDNLVREEIAKKILIKRPDFKTLESARNFFEERYLELGTGAKVLQEIGYKDPSAIMNECLANAEVVDLIEPNLDLVNLLKKISFKYKLYLLTSSPKELSIRKLLKLGIPLELFNFTFWGDDLDVGSKSRGDAFNYVVKKTGIDFSKHLYIGDRLNSDILPAKKLGMKTVAVYSDIPEADYSIKTINDLGDLFNE